MRSPIFAAAFLLPAMTFADGITVEDAYLRASGPMARAAAAFMVIKNDTQAPVTLMGATTDAARTVELHTHIIEDDIAKMREIEDGITIPPGATHELKRGEDHVMLMGLTNKMTDGDVVTLTLSFADADPVTLDVPVDNERKPDQGHSEMDHSDHNNN